MKKFIKKNIKIVFAFILGIIVSGTVVYASGILASTVTYDNRVSNLKDSSNNDVTDVQTAIDILLDRTSNSFCKRIIGNKNTIGSEYVCNPGDGVYRVFYVLSTDDNNVNLIMDRNINSGTVDYDTAKSYINNLNWSNVTVSLPKAQDIANAVGNTSWNVETATTDNWFFFDLNNGVYGQTQVASNSNISAYSWLFNNTRECASYGCSINTSLDSTCAYGYWTQDQISNDTGLAWRVGRLGYLSRNPVSYADYNGVRPVITVSKVSLH